MNNLPKVEREAPQLEIEPATSRLQVRRPNHYATMPQQVYNCAKLITILKSNFLCKDNTVKPLFWWPLIFTVQSITLFWHPFTFLLAGLSNTLK